MEVQYFINLRIRKSQPFHPVVISFKEEPLIMLRQINRTVSIQWILRDQITSAALNECARYKFDISAQYGCTYRNIIAKAHSKILKLRCGCLRIPVLQTAIKTGTQIILPVRE